MHITENYIFKIDFSVICNYIPAIGCAFFFRKLFRNNQKPGSLKQDTHGVCLLISRYYPIDKVYFDDKLRDL